MFYISFIVSFIKIITQKENKITFKNLFNDNLTFKSVHLIEEIFENLSNNDFTFKLVYFNEMIIFNIKSSIFQEKE